MWLEGSVTITDIFGILAYCIMHNLQCSNMFKYEYEKHCACINAHFKQHYATLSQKKLMLLCIFQYAVPKLQYLKFSFFMLTFVSAHSHCLLFTLQVHWNSFYKQIKFSLFLVGWKGANVFWLQMRSTGQRSSD